jgi:hypothetical protein
MRQSKLGKLGKKMESDPDQPFKKGQRVDARFGGTPRAKFYAGRITEVNDDGTYTVRYDVCASTGSADGDVQLEVPASLIRAVATPATPSTQGMPPSTTDSSGPRRSPPAAWAALSGPTGPHPAGGCKSKVKIKVDGKQKHLGSFEGSARGQVAAALAYDAAVWAAGRPEKANFEPADPAGDVPSSNRGRVRAGKRPAGRKIAPSESATVSLELLSEAAEEVDVSEWEVEKILEMRLLGGREEYRVRWAGYDSSEDTWEPEEHLGKGKDQMLRRFRRKCKFAPDEGPPAGGQLSAGPAPQQDEGLEARGERSPGR